MVKKSPIIKWLGRHFTVEFYQLKVFLEVARHLSFTEAADVLNLTQPAVSAKIKALEASLDTELFYRLGRKIELTPVGDYLLEEGPKLIALESHLLNKINEIKQGKFSHLKIGCTHSIARGWLPHLLFRYRQEYPNIQLECLPFDTVQQLHQAITIGDVEIGFSETNLSDFNEITSSPVGSFQYFLMVAADHRLAHCKWLSLQELKSEFWVFPATGTSERLALEGRLSELGMQISDFPHQEVVHTAGLLNTFLTQGHYLGFGSSMQLITERQTKLLVEIPLQEFAFDYQLFMLMPKQLSKMLHRQSQKRGAKTISVEPVQQFIQLVSRESERRRRLRKPSSTTTKYSDGISASSFPSPFAKDARKVHLRSPGIAIQRSKTLTETITLAIGTQNKTIQTVTAGSIIQRLGLLEHFLPRDGQYSNIDYRIKWRDFTSGAPIVAGLQSQELDIGILGDYPLLLSGISPENESLTKTRLVSFVASNPDGTGNTIIVPGRSPLSSLDDLRHRVIAVPFASSAHGMVMRTLSQANLLQDVTLTSINNLSINRLTPQNAEADGYAYFAPLHEIASHRGKFRRLVDTPDMTGLPTFHGIVARKALIDDHPEIVVAYLKALIAAQHWYVTTPSALSLVSNWVSLAPEIVAKTLDYQQPNHTGLFFPATQIKTDWITEHIKQLQIIPGNEELGNIDTNNWIQTEFLETAIKSF
ncbi:MAG: LysR substrate-binding domain-containing protein [Cyanobacteria bacterium P01_D01_bin.156]